MPVTAERCKVLHHVAGRLPELGNGHCVRIAVDGPDGSGKTMFANELAALLRDRARPVVRVSLDDFHNVRTVRYRQGRDSPDGFWQDSYNYARFRVDVLDPLGPGGTRRYRSAAHDLATDSILTPEPQIAAPETVLIVDGLFLHRDELAAIWDLSVFLAVPFAETARRMAVRDGCNPDPEHPTLRRYTEAQRIYFEACNPQQRASILIDNSDIDAPLVIRD